MTEDRIRHRIERYEKRLEHLKVTEKDLSKYGYWDKGYIEGILTILYELLDEIKEKKKVNKNDEK